MECKKFKLLFSDGCVPQVANDLVKQRTEEMN